MKTERSVRQVEGSGDTIPEQANVYVPPRPLAALSEHRTMDVKAIRLAAEVDPRQALTELRLHAPPLKKDNTWIAPLALALLAVGFIALWWLTPTSTLPLSTSTPAKEPPVSAVAPMKTAAPPPPALAFTSERRAPQVAAQGEPAAAPSPTTPALRPPAAAPAPPSHPSAPPRPKQGRDPWLE